MNQNFVASSWFLSYIISTMHGHTNIKKVNKGLGHWNLSDALTAESFAVNDFSNHSEL
jgi:hypothetical protein